MLRGRAFNSADLDHDAVSSQKLCDLFLAAGNTASKIPPDLTLHAVVSKTAARTFWKKQDPVSKTFRWNDAQVMVGMVDDVKEYGIRAKTMPQAYFPHTVEPTLQLVPLSDAQDCNCSQRGSLRGARDGAGARPGAGNTAPADDGGSNRQRYPGCTSPDAAVSVFAALALILAAVGLYGVMSYTVTQRTREIGIRMAVGVKRTDILRMIAWQGLRLTLAGVIAGLLLAASLSRLIAGLLYGVSPLDALTFVGVATLVAAAAYIFPARRATRIDPMLALRYE